MGLVDLNTQRDMSNEIILVVKYIALEYIWGPILSGEVNIAVHWWLYSDTSLCTKNLKTSNLIMVY